MVHTSNYYSHKCVTNVWLLPICGHGIQSWKSTVEQWRKMYVVLGVATNIPVLPDALIKKIFYFAKHLLIELEMVLSYRHFHIYMQFSNGKFLFNIFFKECTIYSFFATWASHSNSTLNKPRLGIFIYLEFVQ